MSLEKLRERMQQVKEDEIAKLYPYLIDVVDIMVQNYHDAEDIVQDAWVKVLESNVAYDPEKSSYRTWVTTFAISEAIDFLRNPRRKAASLDSDEMRDLIEAQWDESHERYDANIDINSSILKLPEEEQRILKLMWEKGYTEKEIAVMLGLTDRQVVKRLYMKARAHLRPLLMEYADVVHSIATKAA